MQQRRDNDIQPWYRQFWFWFLMAPLIAVFFVVGVLLTVAFYNADDVVLDNYYREGRGINQVFEQDIRAQEMGLQASLKFDRTTGEVMAEVNADTSLPEQLLLLMDHPVSARLDQQVKLRQVQPGQYRGDMDIKPQHRWYLYLLPELPPDLRAEAEWRLRAEINFERTDQVELKPRVTHN
ncbi:FixH family protein [Marinimicrobium sp. ABcell2]|uniref:FixH family protein n=1 Tax=Marinimicrobium sp. ABcell2 TaxID=3069751 RepID=UPI0027B224C5|nr:FixH family protein [Marinimicrobium sp. ABcell2]MDQ2078457.1 FixH family protein [Marinimicrobium sp. ABcell2]